MRNNRPENFPWKRIEALIDHYGFRSVSAFARHLGLKRAENLYQIGRGNNKISRELAETICASLPEVNKAWLLTGEGEMQTRGKGEQTHSNVDPSHNDADPPHDNVDRTTNNVDPTNNNADPTHDNVDQTAGAPPIEISLTVRVVIRPR